MHISVLYNILYFKCYYYYYYMANARRLHGNNVDIELCFIFYMHNDSHGRSIVKAITEIYVYYIRLVQTYDFDLIFKLPITVALNIIQNSFEIYSICSAKCQLRIFIRKTIPVF